MCADKDVKSLFDVNVFSCFLRDVDGKASCSELSAGCSVSCIGLCSGVNACNYYFVSGPLWSVLAFW